MQSPIPVFLSVKTKSQRADARAPTDRLSTPCRQNDARPLPLGSQWVVINGHSAANTLPNGLPAGCADDAICCPKLPAIPGGGPAQPVE
jgi:hypothetical protein